MESGAAVNFVQCAGRTDVRAYVRAARRHGAREGEEAAVGRSAACREVAYENRRLSRRHDGACLARAFAV